MISVSSGFRAVGFAPDNAWDYQGNTEKAFYLHDKQELLDSFQETEQECRARGVRLAKASCAVLLFLFSSLFIAFLPI